MLDELYQNQRDMPIPTPGRDKSRSYALAFASLGHGRIHRSPAYVVKSRKVMSVHKGVL